MKKIALVIQRYGNEVNGGAELYARQIAEKIQEYYPEVCLEVLTTCAVDHVTWKNQYREGVSQVNGITVHRFPVQGKRNISAMQKLEPILSRPQNYAGRWRDEVEYIQAQGPYSPALTNYIRNHRNEFDLFLFLGFIFYPTAFGLPLIPEKSVLIPFAHDETITYFRYMRALFHLPKKILFCTPEEQDMIHRVTKNNHIPSDVVGLGFDKPDLAHLPGISTMEDLGASYLLYVGRIEEGKGCLDLIRFHAKYNERHKAEPINLVFVGKVAMDVSQDKHTTYLGFVDDATKHSVMKGAIALVNPSSYESLSMVFMESLLCGTVPIVNAKSAVLKGHCIRGQCGLYYDNYYEFEVAVERLISDAALTRHMVDKGKEYIDEYYSWDAVMPKLQSALDL